MPSFQESIQYAKKHISDQIVPAADALTLFPHALVAGGIAGLFYDEIPNRAADAVAAAGIFMLPLEIVSLLAQVGQAAWVPSWERNCTDSGTAFVTMMTFIALCMATHDYSTALAEPVEPSPFQSFSLAFSYALLAIKFLLKIIHEGLLICADGGWQSQRHPTSLIPAIITLLTTLVSLGATTTAWLRQEEATDVGNTTTLTPIELTELLYSPQLGCAFAMTAVSYAGLSLFYAGLASKDALAGRPDRLLSRRQSSHASTDAQQVDAEAGGNAYEPLGDGDEAVSHTQ